MTLPTTLSPQDFVTNWRKTQLSERASYQAHFIDLCRLLTYENPNGTGKNSKGEIFTFEYSLKKDTGAQGYADVFLQNHFAIEYKAPNKYKDLKAAYEQLLRYREQLHNPPLLVVTDIENWEIHTNWTNTETKVYRFTHDEIAHSARVQDYLRALFFEPHKLHPKRNLEQVTQDAAEVFKLIADNMRSWHAEPQRIAHFLTKLVFCLFAEDVSLLPALPQSEMGIFSQIIEQTRSDSPRFVRYVSELFKAMADGGDVMLAKIPYFNGSLFNDVRVEELTYEALTELERASKLNWAAVEPAIFGTLFERSLDPAKRSQLGAHYTSRADIGLIIEPVLMRPLERAWAAVQAQAEPLASAYAEALKTGNQRQQTLLANQLKALRDSILEQVRSIRVLDPACGSGNFLYVALQALMSLEKEVLFHPYFANLTRPMPEVHPKQMYGMEINPIAHALASIVVWIGWLQWRQDNGYGTSYGKPILQDLSENIVLKDAILAYDSEGKPTESTWQDVDVIIGNPPFLGGKKIREQLGDDYTNTIHAVYPQIHGEADFVTYWFERARQQIAAKKAKRVGLLSTNSIRGIRSRDVLQKIKDGGDIFMAWSDREWINEGAAVRVSMVGFDTGAESEKTLDGLPVKTIYSDLTSLVDITQAKHLEENTAIAFMGITPTGKFVITEAQALDAIQKDGQNKQVLYPYLNGSDITDKSRNVWIVDFTGMDLAEASKYQIPMDYVMKQVKPFRDAHKTKKLRENWWLHEATRSGLRNGLQPLQRFIGTPRVAKHRLFVWIDKSILPDTRLYAFARDDDYFFGVLHSKIHHVWSLRQASWHGVGNDPTYNNTTCFETFPFPYVPSQEDSASPQYQAIASAAKQLHEEREAWLNPPNVSDKRALSQRTLTNLYNALNVFKGVESMRIVASAGDFAPRLLQLHDTLDKAVCAAYAWDENILKDDEAILRHVLSLNLERGK